MFPKAKQEEQPKDPSVQKESVAENNSLQPIGNQASQGMPLVDPGAGNEAMNAQLLDQALNIINDQEPEGGALLEQEPEGEEPQVKDVYYDQMEQKPLFYQDPEEEEKVKEKAEDEDDPLNMSMIVQRPKRRNVKKGAKKKKKSSKKNKDINQINNQMKTIGGLNFNVQKLPARAKTSGWRRFLTGTAKFFGSTLGKAINVVQNFFRGTYFTKKYRQSQSNDTENEVITQEARTHDMIPGWDGAKFEKNPGPNQEDDIMADFRRVPTVWSYVTAGKAEDAEGNPLPPKISVNVSQPKEAVDQTMSGLEMGHSGLGLEYSRYSQISGRYERYALKYGYYQAGANLNTTSLGSTRGGRFPGQLMDERNASWDMSRTFPAKTKQINAIIKASETYADGGYNGLTRNCTTFVKDMVQNVAHLPVPGNIFKMENPSVSSLANFGVFAGVAHDTNAKIGVENRLEELSTQEDKSYAGYGNKRVTKQDYRNYKEHQNDQNTVNSLADIPNAVAENMRRLEGDKSGTATMNSYLGTMEDLNTEAKLPDYINALRSEQTKLRDVILQITGKRDMNELFASVNGSIEAMALLAGIQNTFQPLTNLISDIKSPRRMRLTRAQLDEEINDLNTLLYKVFGNDKRLHVPVMHMISLLKNAADFVDRLYAKSNYGADRDGDLGDIRGKVKSTEYNAKIEQEDISVKMTPSQYEAYIQVYKNPEIAIRKCFELERLKRISKMSSRSLTSREKAELYKGERMEKLADQFDRAHDYMLEKTSYSQQDVDYAFSLGNKEAEGKASGDILEHTTSMVYKALILEKIFGGMKQRFLNHVSDEEADNIDNLQTWLDDDVYTCINRKKDDVRSVMKAMMRNASKDSKGDFMQLEGNFYGLIQINWLDRIFTTNIPESGPLSKMREAYRDCWGNISNKEDSRTNILIKSLMKEVFSEVEH